ncbi:MAG: ISAzo13 family transposase, partial [Proteobacteria bacterium]
KLAEELTTQGHLIGRQKVTELLRELKYSLQGSRKSKEDASNPDRDEQLRQINRRVTDFHRRSQPVVSVDTKKKELVGECAKGGREWSPEGTPPKAKVHDFPDPKVPKAVPYGIYDLQLDEGWVNVGISHAEFAVASLSTWWSNMRRWAYPEATKLLATADAGGSNSARSRLWQVSLQRFADETGLTVAVCH